MATIACPDKRLTPLSPNGFQLVIDKLPNVVYFSQEVNIPAVSLPAAEVNTPFVMIHQAGETLSYGTLDVRFIVDSNMDNYIEIYRWLKGLSFPDGNSTYSQFLAEDKKIGTSENEKNFSDGSLLVYNNVLEPIRTIRFIDLVPISLSGLTFVTDTQEVQYLIGEVSFDYSYYDFA